MLRYEGTLWIKLVHAGTMTIDSWTSSNQPTPISQVRTLIAKHLGVSIGRITDETHFTDDLGADWLDRLD
jgi:hypothetical protein